MYAGSQNLMVFDHSLQHLHQNQPVQATKMFYSKSQLVYAKLFCLKNEIDFTESNHKFETQINWPQSKEKTLTTKVLVTLDSSHLLKLFTVSDHLTQVGQYLS